MPETRFRIYHMDLSLGLLLRHQGVTLPFATITNLCGTHCGSCKSRGSKPLPEFYPFTTLLPLISSGRKEERRNTHHGRGYATPCAGFVFANILPDELSNSVAHGKSPRTCLIPKRLTPFLPVWQFFRSVVNSTRFDPIRPITSNKVQICLTRLLSRITTFAPRKTTKTLFVCPH